MSLFHPRVIEKHVKHIEPLSDRQSDILKSWAEKLSSGTYDSEIQNDDVFIQRILVDVLGYTRSSDGKIWTLAKNQPLEGGGNVDAALGHFSPKETKIIAPFELKGAKTKDLDAVMAGRNKTPVQQAWEYAMDAKGAEWVLVSNYREIRLYAVGYGRKYYESFDLAKIKEPDQFSKFILLLSSNSLLSGKTKNLLKESERVDKDITDKLYEDYKSLRANLIKHIREDNPDKNPLEVIGFAQTILDRVLFIAFAEDKGLLPEETLKKAYEHNDPYNPKPVWDNFKGLFKSINKGNNTLNIPAYNGGLFADDTELDNLNVSNDLCEGFKKIGDYDFDSDVSVNILGHIFEQSISDLEELKAHAENVEEINKKQSKRKKDGVFYTPAYITRYIVEQAVGGWLNDRKKELGFDDLPILEDADYESIKVVVKGRGKKNKTTSIKYNKKIETHIKAWDAYKEVLSNIKVLDPACGSGAFLNEVFDYLKAEGEAVNSELAILKGTQIELFRWDTHILANNIYGVDLNNESVEITKLSLWLKTANRQEKLSYLEDNIKVGNSLIDDPEIAGDYAFSWNKEFSEIISDGGFDVIVGNPPYVFLRNKNMTEDTKTFYRQNYVLYTLKPRTDIYFFERSFSLLSENGYISFIAPNNILTIGSLSNFRRYILTELDKISFVNSKDKVFSDANVDTMIFTARKSSQDNHLIASELHNSEFNFIGKIEKSVFFSDTCVISYEMFSDPQKIKLINKIEEKSESLENFAKVSNGIVTYKVNNGTPRQTREMAEKRIYHSQTKQGEDWLKYIESDDLKRYEFIWSGWYVKYGENIGEKRSKVAFDKKHLLVRVIPSKAPYCINAMIIEDHFINDQNYIVAFDFKTDIYNVLALLNSKLSSFWFINKLGKMQRGLFPQLKAGELKKFPIFLENSDYVGIKAKKLLEFKKKFQKSVISFYELLKTEIKIKKISRKLENWFELEFSEFSKEIEKLIKPEKLSLSQKSEWKEYFEKEKTKALELKNKINQIDREIDQMVYELYELTPEEIELIENTEN